MTTEATEAPQTAPNQENTPLPEATTQEGETGTTTEQDTEQQGEPKPTEQEQRFAAKFAALARKEKLIREREAQLKALEQKVNSWEAAKATAKQNPMAILSEAGLSTDDLAEYLISNGKPKEKTPSDEIRELREMIERERQERAAQEAEAREQSIKGMIKDLATSSDDYELVAAQGDDGIDLVFQVMAEYYNTHKQNLSLKQALSMTETWLDKQAEERILKAKKIRSRFEKTPVQPATTPSNQAKPKDSPTITHSLTNIPPGTTNYIHDRDESLKRAAALLKFT